MQHVAERCQSKNMEPSGHYSPAQPIQVECMSSLCRLWAVLSLHRGSLKHYDYSLFNLKYKVFKTKYIYSGWPKLF